MRVVVDTNVLVSALLSPKGAPRVILKLFLSRKLEWLVNDLILQEYEDVLSREEFGFRPSDILRLLEFIRKYAVHIPYVPEKINIPHAADLPFILCARQGKALSVITGNKKHFPSSCSQGHGFTIDLPADFLAKVARHT